MKHLEKKPLWGGLLFLALVGGLICWDLWPTNQPASIVMCAFFCVAGGLFAFSLRTTPPH